MNPEIIISNIQDQVSLLNQSFPENPGKQTPGGFSGNDIELQTKMLKKITRIFNFYRIITISYTTLLVLVSMLKYFDSLSWGNMNKSGLFILFAVVFLLTTFRYYKLKVNLEYKIYLLALIKQIEKL